MKPNTLSLLQSLLVTGHIMNAGIAGVTHNPLATLLLGAALGGLQMYVQLQGNASMPPLDTPPPGEKTVLKMTATNEEQTTDIKTGPPK